MKVRRIDFYPDDWLAGTRGLSNAQAGLFWNICALIYSKGGEPVTLAMIKRLFHDKRFQETFDILTSIGKISTNNAIYQEVIGAPETVIVSVLRCDRELIRVRQRIDRRAYASNKLLNGKEKVKSSRARVHTIINQHTTVNKKETRASRASYSDEFERWWDAYPEKVGKGAAWKAFAKALAQVSLDELIASVGRYKASKPPDRAWCNPVTWLNQERWLDEPANGLTIAPSGPLTECCKTCGQRHETFDDYRAAHPPPTYVISAQ